MWLKIMIIRVNGLYFQLIVDISVGSNHFLFSLLIRSSGFLLEEIIVKNRVTKRKVHSLPCTSVQILYKGADVQRLSEKGPSGNFETILERCPCCSSVFTFENQALPRKKSRQFLKWGKQSSGLSRCVRIGRLSVQTHRALSQAQGRSLVTRLWVTVQWKSEPINALINIG